MDSWAQWTAKTALLAAGFAAAAGGLSGVALAAGGQSPASPCGSAAAVLGDSTAGIPVPGTALSAASTPGMSSDSFAALAVGALLAGASALKIAGRRARRRRNSEV